MNNKIFCLLCGVMVYGVLWAGDIERVSATYEYISNNPNETPAQAETTAIERARQKALEDKFGVDVSSVTQTLQHNRANTSDTQTETNVFSVGGTSVRGEWIETTKEQVLEKKFVDGFWIIKVHVAGKARNLSAEKTDIHFAFVRDVQDIEPPVTFRDGNDLFMRFSSPVAGSLCVYLIDEEQNAFCLLPYSNVQSGTQQVEANQEYIFFSQKYDSNAQEYTVNSQRSSEQNALFVIFSPNTFTKAHDNQSGSNWRDEQMPRQLSYADFLKWLERNQAKDAAMVVQREIITIHK